jgi:APA family basic amino acid/polyamine antiporter
VTSPGEDSHGLRRALGLWPATAIVVGTVIGSGIFLVPADMVRAVGSPARVFAVWIFGGILTMFGALTFAELSAAMPEAGGGYAYLKAAYGPLWSFMFGWTTTVIFEPASLAALAVGFCAYLSDFFPGLQAEAWIVPLPIGPGGAPLEIRYAQFVAIGILMFLMGVNYLGVQVGGRVQVALTGLKLALIGGVIAAGLLWGHPTGETMHQAAIAHPGGVAGFFAALVAALWAYDGWSNSTSVGSEIERPGRNLPRSLIIGSAITIVFYLLANLAYFSVLSGPEAAQSSRLAADMMRKIAGSKGAAAISLAAMVSIFGSLNGSLLSNSRIPFALARDGYFFRSVAWIHPRHRTPSTAILFLGLWSCVLVLSGQFSELYTLAIFPGWILYAMTGASVIVLRRKLPDLPRPYRVWGYPVVPALFVLVAGVLLYSTLQTSPRESGIGLVVILAGLPFYFHWKRRMAR